MEAIVCEEDDFGLWMKLKDLGPLGGLQWAGGQEPQRASWSSEGLVEGANEVLKIRGYAKASTCHLKTESKVREKAPSSVPIAPSSDALCS